MNETYFVFWWNSLIKLFGDAVQLSEGVAHVEHCIRELVKISVKLFRLFPQPWKLSEDIITFCSRNRSWRRGRQFASGTNSRCY
jgi:hypothetical protein